jgi:hypothetical protein
MIRLRLRPLAAVGGAACGGSPPFMPKSTLAPTAAAGGGLGIMTFLRESPYKAGLIIATLKTAACDLIVQVGIELLFQLRTLLSRLVMFSSSC